MGRPRGPPLRIPAQYDNVRRNRKHAMTTLVRNHSHYGAYIAEVEGGRIVGVRPFEHDPNPSPIIEGVPETVHSRERIPCPMLSEGRPGQGGGKCEGPGR